MRISIVTPTLNQAEFIEDTISSVLKQNFTDFEHIIIDGGSTDGTIEILEKYSHLKWISEKDTGQSNAINKGFRIATGDIVAWINSDDYYENDVLTIVNDYFERNTDCKFLYGNLTFVNKNKQLLFRTNSGGISYRTLLDNPDIVRQPSCFWKKDVLSEVGYLNERLHLVMDYDLFLRISRKHAFHYVNKNFSYFRHYKDGKSSKYAKKQFHELVSVMIKTPAVFNIRSYLYLYRKFHRAFLLAGN